LAGITQNLFFLLIVGAILAVQIILVTFTGFAFGLYDKGLTIQHWLICVHNLSSRSAWPQSH